MAPQADLVEAAHHEIAAAVVLRPHLLHAVPPVAQGLQRGILRDDRGAQHRVLVDLHHRVDQRRRSAGVADAPPGHRESLREAVQENRPLRHPRQAGDAGVGAVERKLRVDLVGQDEQVLLAAEIGDLLQLLAAACAARRVARQVEHQDFRAGLPGRAQGLGGDGKVILGEGRHGDGLAVRQHDARVIAHIARLVVHHLVARVDKGAACEVERFAHADGHDHLVFRPVRDVEMLLHILCDFLAQFQLTQVGRVRGAAAIHARQRVVPDVLGRDEVRLAHPQRDDALPLQLGDQLKKVADAALRQGGDVLRDPGTVCGGGVHVVTFHQRRRRGAV